MNQAPARPERSGSSTIVPLTDMPTTSPADTDPVHALVEVVHRPVEALPGVAAQALETLPQVGVGLARGRSVHPGREGLGRAAWQVMRTGQSELIPEISDEMIAAGAVDDEHLKIALALRLRSAVTVPLSSLVGSGIRVRSAEK